MIAMGIVYLISPQAMKKTFIFLSEGKRFYLVALVRILLGLVLLIAASQCRIPLLVTVIGILPLVGGVLIPALGLARCKEMVRWWQEKPDNVLRLLSLAPAGIGVLLFYAA